MNCYQHLLETTKRKRKFKLFIYGYYSLLIAVYLFYNLLVLLAYFNLSHTYKHLFFYLKY